MTAGKRLAAIRSAANRCLLCKLCELTMPHHVKNALLEIRKLTSPPKTRRRNAAGRKR